MGGCLPEALEALTRCCDIHIPTLTLPADDLAVNPVLTWRVAEQ